MKKIFLLTIAILIFAAQTALAVNYPCIGYCTGNSVRLRDEPGTKNTEILDGRLFEGNIVVLLDEDKAGGEKWYEIEYPFGDDSAWVIAKYIELEDYEIDFPEYRIQVYRDFGTTAEKAKSLLGKPKKYKKKKIDDPENSLQGETEEILTYSNLILKYYNQRLRSVEVTGSNDANFGGISVGDSVEKLRKKFGKPTDEDKNCLTYWVSEGNGFSFYVKNGKIYKMDYTEFMD